MYENGSIDNLRNLYKQADDIDIVEGKLAYTRYNKLMQIIATKYSVSLDKVIAAFCAMSPNNDYKGNIRSLITVLNYLNKGISSDLINISTYNHCKNRAIKYIIDESNFLETVKGPKIRSFYYNILNPNDINYVTIDGHMVAAYVNKNLTMHEALIKPKEYPLFVSAFKQFSDEIGLIPNQLQAILWFTRKRIFNILSNNQFDLFKYNEDLWEIMIDLDNIKPYPLKIRNVDG